MEETENLSMARQEELFTQMLDQYEKLVFSICVRMTKNYFDAEDLTQETFLAVYKALPSFDGVNPGGFVTRIATNKCLDYLKRAEHRTTLVEDQKLAEYQAEGSEPEHILWQKEIKRELEKACLGLKSPYGEVALAYYCRGQTTLQIAESLGKKTKTIQTQLRRAKGMLQKIIKKEGII